MLSFKDFSSVCLNFTLMSFFYSRYVRSSFFIFCFLKLDISKLRCTLN